jgi:hypothetical protein
MHIPTRVCHSFLSKMWLKGLFQALNLFYSQLEALALREEFNPDEFNDQSAPQTELMLDVRANI